MGGGKSASNEVAGARSLGRYVECRQRPHDGVDEQQQRAGSDEHLEIGESPRAKLPQQPQRPAHVYQVGLQVPLDPAGALPDPGPDPGDGFFPCRRVEHGHAEARTAETDTEVTVLGDVERVPSADAAEFLGPEVVGCAA